MDLHAHDYALEQLAFARLSEARARADRHRLARLGDHRTPEGAIRGSGVREAIHAFIAAWNAHSPGALRDVFADDGWLCDPAAPDGLPRPAIGAIVQRTVERIPDVSFALTSVVEAGDGSAAFEWRMTGTAIAPDGRSVPVRLEGCEVCRVRDGKIVEMRGYFDRARFMEQLGTS